MAMIKQSNFYNALKAIPGVAIVQQFRQTGTGGYLPKGSNGACSFTTLDFHRAATQGTLDQWSSRAGQNPGGRIRDLGKADTTNFGARQQLMFECFDKICDDPLFTRTMTDLPKLDASGVRNTFMAETEEFSAPAASAAPLSFQDSVLSGVKLKSGYIPDYHLMANDDFHCIRLNFSVAPKGSESGGYGHVVGLFQSPDDKNNWIFMDPNAGVFKVEQNALPAFLRAYQNSLYQDYTIAHIAVEKQEPFWLAPAQAFTMHDKVKFAQQEINGHEFDLHSGQSFINYQVQCLAELIKQRVEEQKTVVDDCSFDDEDSHLAVVSGLAAMKQQIAHDRGAAIASDTDTDTDTDSDAEEEGEREADGSTNHA